MITVADVNMFEQELRAAALAGVVIGWDEALHSNPAANAISHVATQPNHVASHESLTEAVGIPRRYAAALTAWVQTRDMGLVLDGLTHGEFRSPRSLWSSMDSTSRRAVGYFATILMIAAGGIVLFQCFTAPSIDRLRSDVMWMPVLQFRTPEMVRISAVGLWTCGLFAIALLAGVGVTWRRLRLWADLDALDHRTASRCKLAAILMAATRDASERADEESGSDKLSTASAWTIAGDLLDDRAEPERSGSLESQTELDWNAQAVVLDRQIGRRGRLRRRLVPVVAVVLAGIGISLPYGIFVFRPVVTLLESLVEPPRLEPIVLALPWSAR
ncbi:MAG: hypothetical protein AAF670_09520 [Planctomycetota bacterium]